MKRLVITDIADAQRAKSFQQKKLLPDWNPPIPEDPNYEEDVRSMNERCANSGVCGGRPGLLES